MTLRLRLIALFIVVAAAAAGAAGCAGKSINHVLADPSRYRNREIKVSGNVVNAYSIAGRGVYQIEDKTGRLWVASDRGVPHRGARVSVTGTIREGFNLGPLADFAKLSDGALIMIEREHKARY